jgi:transposase
MKRENRTTWLKRIERWRDSGLTAKEFAREIGVNENTLKNWGWRVAADERAAAKAGATKQGEIEPLRFVEVTTPAEPSPATMPLSTAEKLELVLASGMAVRVPSSFDAATLRRLLTVVG